MKTALTFFLFSITAMAQVHFRVQLDWDNSTCVSGKNCNASVYRATCTGSISNCPQYSTSTAGFTLLTGTTSQTVSATNTHFVYVDTVGLANNTPYAYAVTNSFQANPSTPSLSTQIQLLTPTGVHNATLNYSNSACTTTYQCSIQIYRATCASSTSCPSYTQGSSSFKALTMTTGLVPTIGAQGTSWKYTDSDTALIGSTTYVWVATNTFQNASTASAASTPFVGTTSVGRSKNEKTTTLHISPK